MNSPFVRVDPFTLPIQSIAAIQANSILSMSFPHGSVPSEPVHPHLPTRRRFAVSCAVRLGFAMHAERHEHSGGHGAYN